MHPHLVMFVKSKFIHCTNIQEFNLIFNDCSTFGLAFEEAVENTKARISFDSFDQTVIQVHNNDIEHFIESLHYKTR